MNDVSTSLSILKAATEEDSVYVLNTSEKLFPNGIRGSINFSVRTQLGLVDINVPDTTIPFNISGLADVKDLRRSQDLRNIIASGGLSVVDEDTAIMLLANPEAQNELRRVSRAGNERKSAEGDFTEHATPHAKKVMGEVAGMAISLAEQTYENWFNRAITLESAVVIFTALRPTIDSATMARLLAKENLPREIRAVLQAVPNAPAQRRAPTPTASVAAKKAPAPAIIAAKAPVMALRRGVSISKK